MTQGADDIVFIGQWYHPALNPDHFIALEEQVAQASDLEMRRNNNRVGNQYHDISGKLEISRYHTHVINERVQAGWEKIDQMLVDLRADLGRSRESLAKAAFSNNQLLEFRDHILVAHVEALLVSSKALLDSLAQFYSIAFDRNVRAFRDSGSEMLKDIAKLDAVHSEAGRSMGRLINEAKWAWIDEMIDYRDQVVHFGQLRQMYCMHVSMAEGVTESSRRVLKAVMPSRRPIDLYATDLLRNMHSFTAKWIAILFEQLRSKPPSSTSPTMGNGVTGEDLAL